MIIDLEMIVQSENDAKPKNDKVIENSTQPKKGKVIENAAQPKKNKVVENAAADKIGKAPKLQEKGFNSWMAEIYIILSVFSYN